jgi:hypothetical protein
MNPPPPRASTTARHDAGTVSQQRLVRAANIAGVLDHIWAASLSPGRQYLHGDGPRPDRLHHRYNRVDHVELSGVLRSPDVQFSAPDRPHRQQQSAWPDALISRDRPATGVEFQIPRARASRLAVTRGKVRVDASPV